MKTRLTIFILGVSLMLASASYGHSEQEGRYHLQQLPIAEAILDSEENMFFFKLLKPIDYTTGCDRPVNATLEYVAYPFNAIKNFLDSRWYVLVVDPKATGTSVSFSLALEHCSDFKEITMRNTKKKAYLASRLTVHFVQEKIRIQWVDTIQQEVERRREKLKTKGGGDIPLQVR